MNIKPNSQVDLLIETGDGRIIVAEIKTKIERLTRSQILEQTQALWPKATAVAVITGGDRVGVKLEGLIDFEQERQRLSKEIEKLRAESSRLEAQLANQQFTERAPIEKVNEMRVRVADIAERTTQLQGTIDNLQ
jgi:valyl-tRNA synthetase